ncbi:MAG: RluA family pseudouridine synthase [Alphaproteobacteria bacterium]
MSNNYSKITLPEVPSSHNNERIDKWISSESKEISRSRVQQLIEQGYVLKNNDIINDAAKKVHQGDIIEILIPPAEEAIPVGEKIDLDIVYEDEDLIVINKNPNMVVHPAPGNSSGTLVNALIEHCGSSLSGIGGVKRPGIVHRIDKDTSGLIVIAKNDLAHQSLSEQFAAHSIRRAYIAVVWGVPKPLKGRIETNLGRHKVNRKKMAVLKSGGKVAITNYETIKNIQNMVSVLECRLETGRTHQIRVHMAHIGCPLVGDQTYGNNKKHLAKFFENAVVKDFLRQALHAKELGFIHPRTQKEMFFSKDMPEDMKILIESFDD